MKGKFLRTPKIYKDESIISYLYRLSEENSAPFDWIVEEIDPKIKNNVNKINAINDFKRIEKVLALTGITRDNMKYMTINRFCNDDTWGNERYNYIKMNFNNFPQYIDINTGKYCPICLKQNRYHRIWWHISTIEICFEHSTHLVRECKFCGNNLTISNVLSGKCSCGARLIDNPTEICSDNNIINIQSLIYNNAMKKEHNNIHSISFLESVHQMYHLLKFNIENFPLLKSKFKPQTHHSKNLFCFHILNKIIKGNKEYLYLLLDELNNIFEIELHRCVEEIKYGDALGYNEKIKYIDSMMFYASPLSIISEYNCNNFFKMNIDIFESSIIEYFYKYYTEAFFKKRFRGFILQDEYIDIYFACVVFKLDIFTIQEHFEIKEIKGVLYVKLSQIVLFILSYIKKSNMLSKLDSDEVSVQEISYLLGYSISNFQIFEELKSGNFEYSFDPFMFGGMNMITISKNCLLEIKWVRVKASLNCLHC